LVSWATKGVNILSAIDTSRLLKFQSDARHLLDRGDRDRPLLSDQDRGTRTPGDRVTLGQSNAEAVTYGEGVGQEIIQSPYELLHSRLVTLLQEQGVAVQLATGGSEIDIASLTPEEAQVLVAEDGYFGVEQTSERIFQFAVGLAGSDPSRLDEILQGIEDGFDEAEQAWGGRLPEISYQTHDAIKNKIAHWLEGPASA
jgi:hypothetical protein